MKKLKLFLFILLLGFTYIQIFAQKKHSQKEDNIVVFYIARHGKTMLNTLDRVQGWADSPLTPAGIEVAEYLGKGLHGIVFKAAYSSDLGRARQTARIALENKGDQKINIEEVPELKETNFGSYEGDLNNKMWGDIALYLHYKTPEDLFKAMPQNPNLLKEGLAVVKFLDKIGMAEDYNEVRIRGQKALKKIAEKEASKGGGNIFIVSHGMAIGIFLSNLDDSGKLINSTHMGNAAISKVIYKNGKFYVESVGDMSYVEKGRNIN